MITHPEKVLFPEDGITKGELAAYYEAVAPVMLPHLQGRPVTMERYPSGIGRKGFWQKDVSRGFPEWLTRVEVPKKGGAVHHPLANDARASFAHRAGAVLVKRSPERLTREFLKVDRGDRVLVDTGRNGWSATFAAAYTVRAREGAPVSAPCTWSEVEGGEVAPRSFTLRSMAQRLAAVGDLWSDLPASGQSLREPLERLRSL